jgi:2-methyl-3-hydroxypyridine 5-carboxylic acid dioxygenase
MSEKRHAEIAGAGFAGLTAAIALRQRGWSVRVHEKQPELREFGAGIFMWENGLRILKALGADQDYLSGCHEAPLMETRGPHNEQLHVERFGPERGTRMITSTRQHLFSSLLRSARVWEVDFRLSSEVLSAEPLGRLRTADGATFDADLVIAADGVRSQVRDSLDFGTRRTQYDQAVIRMLIPRDSNDLGGGTDSVINFWTPKHRVLYVPCNPRDLYLMLGAHRADAAAIALPVNTRLWSENFPCLAGVILRISNRGRQDLYETTTLSTWVRGRVAVLGDAAHAMPPTLGQGAGCAMMNALALAVILEREPNIDRALPLWEHTQRPITDHTQAVSATFAQSRAGSDGKSKWSDEALLTARSIPEGTADEAPSHFAA